MKFFFLSYLPYWLLQLVQNPKRKSISSLLIVSRHWDGLHYLYSYDGYHWDSIAGSWLKPEIGNKTPYYNYFTKQTEEQKYAPNSMMRDPSITQGPDGTFHLVWTISWNGEQGFGYASSKDLIHWSEQREIKVMKDSLTNNVWAPEVFYDDEKGQFIVAWSSAIPVERYTAADSLGANKSHRAYYTTTKDFQTFAPAKAFYDPDLILLTDL